MSMASILICKLSKLLLDIKKSRDKIKDHYWRNADVNNLKTFCLKSKVIQY